MPTRLTNTIDPTRPGACVPIPDLFLIGRLVLVVNNISTLEIINPKFVVGLCLHTANHISQSCSVKHGVGKEFVIKQEVDFRLHLTMQLN